MPSLTPIRSSATTRRSSKRYAMAGSRRTPARVVWPPRCDESGRTEFNRCEQDCFVKFALKTPIALSALLFASAVAAPVRAQVAPGSAQDLAVEFTDPLTPLPQIFVQDAYTPSNFGTNVQTNSAVTRLIIPRVPRLSFFPFDQIVRPSFSLVTVPYGTGKQTRTEFGDAQLFDLALMPWPDETSGFKLGFGPTFVFPTATSTSAGKRAWQAGPAGALVYTGTPGLLAGFL